MEANRQREEVCDQTVLRMADAQGDFVQKAPRDACVFVIDGDRGLYGGGSAQPVSISWRADRKAGVLHHSLTTKPMAATSIIMTASSTQQKVTEFYHQQEQ